MKNKIVHLWLITQFLFSFLSAHGDIDLFNGKDLSAWLGKKEFWRVENGTIVGETTKEIPTKGNTFLIWKGGEVEDFEFSCQVKFQGNNSGIQYRSEAVGDLDDCVLRGTRQTYTPSRNSSGCFMEKNSAKEESSPGVGKKWMPEETKM